MLTECSTAEPLPIFPGAAFPEVERAYLGAAVAPETPVFAEVDARFEERAPEPGVPPREGIVVDSVVSVDPNRSCGTAKR